MTQNANPETRETRLRGVYKAEDFADKVQKDWQTGIAPGDSCGWFSLDQNYLVKRGQWTVLTGIPNHGKSTWLDNVMVNMAKSLDWKFLVCSPENQPIERHIESLIEIYTGKKFEDSRKYESYSNRFLTIEELAEGLKFVNEHFEFIYPEETDFNIDYILALGSEVKTGFNFDGFVIDPYNELEHKRPSAMTETEYISAILSKFRRFNRANNTHGWMVAHPTKLKELPNAEVNGKSLKVYAMPSLYDIAGSANWRNKADMGVVVYRNIQSQPETTTISVQKVRFRECGSIGQADFYYDFLCNRFVEREEELLFNKAR